MPHVELIKGDFLKEIATSELACAKKEIQIMENTLEDIRDSADDSGGDPNVYRVGFLFRLNIILSSIAKVEEAIAADIGSQVELYRGSGKVLPLLQSLNQKMLDDEDAISNIEAYLHHKQHVGGGEIEPRDLVGYIIELANTKEEIRLGIR